MVVAITGGEGMLGRTLQKYLHQHTVESLDLPDFDMTNIDDTRDTLYNLRPDVIVHCAAMTDVVGCERNPDKAFKINAFGSSVIATIAHDIGAHLIAISTDYVFDGYLTRPYSEYDEPNPVNIYGQSKLAGEQVIQALCPNHTIIRTSWLYGSTGPSFYHTILRLAEQDKPLEVVSDQIGNPTSTDALSQLIVALIDNPVRGIIHGTCEGEASWYDFADKICKCHRLKKDIIPTCTPDIGIVQRPMNSRLDKSVLRNSGIFVMPHWKDALKAFIIK